MLKGVDLVVGVEPPHLAGVEVYEVLTWVAVVVEVVFLLVDVQV